MNFSITQVGGRANSPAVRSYIIDTLADLNTLPTQTQKGKSGINGNDDCCAPGSDTLCLEDSSVWVLGNDDNWHQIRSGGGSGKDGFSPIIEVEKDTDTEYILKITTATGSFLTPNLKGSGGSGITKQEVENMVDDATNDIPDEEVEQIFRNLFSSL